MKKGFSLIELSIVILIIGILVTGVTQGSRLIYQIKLENARVLTQNSPVNSINGIITWVESTGVNAINSSEYDDDQEVLSWNDINPQIIDAEKINFLQNNSEQLPIFKENIFNDLPALRFDGIDDNLSTDKIESTTATPNSENTLFFVFRLMTDRDYPTIQTIFSYQVGSNKRISFQVNSPPTIRFDYANSGSHVVSTTELTNAPIVLTLQRKNGTQSIFINGKLNASENYETEVQPFNYGMSIGRYYSNGYFPSQVDMAEIIIFDHAIKNQDRQSVEKYLLNKWGI